MQFCNKSICVSKLNLLVDFLRRQAAVFKNGFLIRTQIVDKSVTTTLHIYAEEFEEANTASVETISSCISIPSVTKTTEE